jgi:heme-degrading monooxygenase HmoA
MDGANQPYSAGNWTVKAGSEKEFIEAWTAFTRWSSDNVPGSESFVLIQDQENPQHFLSFGAWRDEDSMRVWRQRPEFQQLFDRCYKLCDEMSASSYTLSSQQAPSVLAAGR